VVRYLEGEAGGKDPFKQSEDQVAVVTQPTGLPEKSLYLVVDAFHAPVHGELVLQAAFCAYSGCRFICSHSRQVDLDLAINLALPLRSAEPLFTETGMFP
jgi:hypothetical protein